MSQAAFGRFSFFKVWLETFARPATSALWRSFFLLAAACSGRRHHELRQQLKHLSLGDC
jgi:hypothetical protein